MCNDVFTCTDILRFNNNSKKPTKKKGQTLVNTAIETLIYFHSYQPNSHTIIQDLLYLHVNLYDNCKLTEQY